MHKALVVAARQEQIAWKWTSLKQMEIVQFRLLGILGSTKTEIVTGMAVQSQQTWVARCMSGQLLIALVTCVSTTMA